MERYTEKFIEWDSKMRVLSKEAEEAQINYNQAKAEEKNDLFKVWQEKKDAVAKFYDEDKPLPFPPLVSHTRGGVWREIEI